MATYLNLGPIRNRGFEASIEHRLNNEWLRERRLLVPEDPANARSGVSPDPLPDPGGGHRPAKNRFNLPSATTGPVFWGNVNVNYSDSAFWNDVLNAPYDGLTDAYTMVNATIGVRFADGKASVSLRGYQPT